MKPSGSAQSYPAQAGIYTSCYQNSLECLCLCCQGYHQAFICSEDFIHNVHIQAGMGRAWLIVVMADYNNN